MPNFSSTQYTNQITNKYITDSRDRGGPIYCLTFSYTVSTDVSGDTVNLVLAPSGWQILGFDISNDAMGSSTTMSIGDAGSATRLYPATSVTSAGKITGLLSAGQNFRYTADTIIIATWGGATPTTTAVLKGLFYFIPAA